MSVATPPYKKEKIDCGVIDLEEVPMTCVNDVNSLAAPWQCVGRTTLSEGDRMCIVSGDKLNDKHMHFAQMLIKQQILSKFCTPKRITGLLRLQSDVLKERSMFMTPYMNQLKHLLLL